MFEQSGKNLGFIFCLPRSGSTLLSVVLNNHPNIYCPPEPWFLLKLVKIMDKGNPDAKFNDDLSEIGTNEFISSERK